MTSTETPSSAPAPAQPSGWKRAFRIFLRFLLVVFLFGVGFLIWLNWGGTSEWEKVKAEIEAKGQSLNYQDFIPKPVPDDQNALAAPGIAEVFVNPPLNNFWNDYSELKTTASSRAKDSPKVGTVTFTVDPGAPEGTPHDQVAKALNEAVAASWPDLKHVAFLGFHLSTQNTAPLSRLDLTVKARTSPAPQLHKASVSGTAFAFELRPTATEGVFDLHLTSSMLIFADEFIAWTKRLDPILDQVRAAAARPHTYIEGDYSIPYASPIPKFNPIRSFARLTEQRALLHLRQGHPDAAFRDLENIVAIRQLIASPDFTLVSAMMSAVVTEISQNIIREGFARSVWKQEHLPALTSLSQGNSSLLTNLQRSFQLERSSVVWMVENGDFPQGEENSWKWDYISFFLKGCLDHNRATFCRFLSLSIDGLTPQVPRIDVDKQVKAEREMEAFVESSDMRDFLTIMAMPGYSRVSREAARTQTQVQLATLACALERNRLDTGAYPEKLDGLVPKYLPKLPVQVVNGQPYLYRKETDGGCAIWSIGWDLKDDNGNPGTSPKLDANSPDWAWKLPAQKP